MICCLHLQRQHLLQMSNTPINCPADLVLVNQNKIRIIALQVWLLAIVFWLTHIAASVALLVVDFFLRSFSLQQYSPLAFIADAVIKQLHIKSKQVDQAPKRFAARMGFAITSLLLLLNIIGIALLVNAIVALLIFFSFLESFFGICVGCHIYTYWIRVTRVFSK